MRLAGTPTRTITGVVTRSYPPTGLVTNSAPCTFLRQACSIGRWWSTRLCVDCNERQTGGDCNRVRRSDADKLGWNNVNKRYLRFGRGDPFLRFGRSQTLSAVPNLGYRFGKRSADDDALDTYLENGGYLRFGRSVPQSPLLSLLADGAHLRKRRDVSGETPEMQRATRGVKDGGFLRFGRDGDDSSEDVVSQDPASKRAAGKREPQEDGDMEYVRFGRSRPSGFPRFGKRYLRFGRGGREGYLRFGKRSQES